jgi:hypothetical protein
MGRRSDAADQTGDVASAKRLADPALSSSDSGIVARWITGNDSSGGMKSKAMRCPMGDAVSDAKDAPRGDPDRRSRP